jgi:hypothetical protein
MSASESLKLAVYVKSCTKLKDLPDKLLEVVLV